MMGEIPSLGDLHELNIPYVLAAIWRGLFFVSAAWAFPQMLQFVRWPGLPLSRRWLMAALALIIGRTIWVNYLRWGEPLYYECLPIDTLALALAWKGVCDWKREPGGPLSKEEA